MYCTDLFEELIKIQCHSVLTYAFNKPLSATRFAVGSIVCSYFTLILKYIALPNTSIYTDYMFIA